MRPQFFLFAQHGWADTHHAIRSLAEQVAPPDWVIAPDLGWLRTWWRIAPLIATVEAQAQAIAHHYPGIPWRIVGHSMGGLIWLEILAQHPEWWPRVHSFILVASPVGGALWGRWLSPFDIGLSIARDLGVNRRELASRLAEHLPMLSIAGDLGHGHDGTVRVTTTQFPGARSLTLPHSHPALKKHPALIPVIQEFWQVGAIGL